VAASTGRKTGENHVDMLENDFVGPLYKTVLHRPPNRRFFEKYVLGPQAISVSQVNLVVSIFTIFIWLALIIHSLPPFLRNEPVSWGHVTIGGITLFVILFMRFRTTSHLDSYEHVVTERKSKIVGTTE
jgi:hypothetical protein